MRVPPHVSSTSSGWAAMASKSSLIVFPRPPILAGRKLSAPMTSTLTEPMTDVLTPTMTAAESRLGSPRQSRVALVTGAAKRLGRAVAPLLAKGSLRHGARSGKTGPPCPNHPRRPDPSRRHSQPVRANRPALRPSGHPGQQRRQLPRNPFRPNHGSRLGRLPKLQLKSAIFLLTSRGPAPEIRARRNHKFRRRRRPPRLAQFHPPQRFQSRRNHAHPRASQGTSPRNPRQRHRPRHHHHARRPTRMAARFHQARPLAAHRHARRHRGRGVLSGERKIRHRASLGNRRRQGVVEAILQRPPSEASALASNVKPAIPQSRDERGPQAPMNSVNRKILTIHGKDFS